MDKRDDNEVDKRDDDDVMIRDDNEVEQEIQMCSQLCDMIMKRIMLI